MSDIPDIPTALGNWPILQGILGMGALVGGFMIWLRGENKKKDAAPSGGTQMYLDGPVVRALDYLQGIYRTLVEMRKDNERVAAALVKNDEKYLDLLEEIKDRLSERRR